MTLFINLPYGHKQERNTDDRDFHGFLTKVVLT